MNECNVCCEAFNRSTRKQITCHMCNYDACMSCCKSYILGSVEEAHCMNCKKVWSREFMLTNFTKVFVIKEYKTHRENILFDRERALLPETQVLIEHENRVREAKQDVEKFQKLHNDKLKEFRKCTDSTICIELHKEMSNIRDEWKEATRKYNEMRRGDKKVKSVRQFVRACPATDCRGFLSTQWKCGLCSVWVCPHCHEIKGNEKDANHVCKKENVETAQLLAKDTKPCPKCASMIFKIDGCFAKDTPILLWNGSTKMSQDICEGDVLVGDDGNRRIVQETRVGEDEMFEVSQTNGMTYIVNSQHKLALKFSGDKTIYWKESESAWYMRWFDHNIMNMVSKKSPVSSTVSKKDALKKLEEFRDTIQFPDVIEITVSDYMQLSRSCKKHLMGYKGNGINWEAQTVSLDPYMLGLYLGDGNSNGCSFAADPAADPEILHYILQWCRENNAELVHDAAYSFRIRRRSDTPSRLAIGRGACSSSCKGCSDKICNLCDLPNVPYSVEYQYSTMNPYKAALGKYNLVQNKHIPSQYLHNDRHTRLALLAGVIDTDGYVSNNGKRVTIPQANQDLCRQIELLSKSLGYTVTSRIVKKLNVPFPNVARKDYKDQLVLNLSGESLSEIPCLVKRKQCVSSTPNKDYMRTSIHVKSIGRGTYYGWSVAGPNKRFLLRDFTVVRNCDQMYCVQCHTAFSWRSGNIENGHVHNPHYYEYLRRIGKDVPRAPGDIPCNENAQYLPDIHTIWRKVRLHGLSNITFDSLCEPHRSVMHVRYDLLPRFRTDNVADNRDLRAQYLRQEIDTERFKWLLQKREKARKKKQDYHNIIQLYFNVCCDLFARVSNAHSDKEIMDILQEWETLKRYTNESLATVGELFQCKPVVV